MSRQYPSSLPRWQTGWLLRQTRAHPPLPVPERRNSIMQIHNFEPICQRAVVCIAHSRPKGFQAEKQFSARGQALVPVIFIMLILTTLVIAFEISASRELRSGANFSTQTQRYYAARGAI